MIKLNRTTEYGLIALRHINKVSPELTSAREIADIYGLPFEITAKTLQRLKDTGLINSAHGSRGGYTMGRSLETVSVAEFMEMMEGPQAIVPCGGTNQGATSNDNDEPHACAYHTRCEIKGVMDGLNSRLRDFLSNIHLKELT